MYTKILAQGAKFGSGATSLDNPAVQSTVQHLFLRVYLIRLPT